MLNPYLLSLIGKPLNEADGDEENPTEDENKAPKNQTDEENPEGEEQQESDDPAEQEDPFGLDNDGDGTPDDGTGDAVEDFGMDDDTADDTDTQATGGSTASLNTETDEKNIQINILDISKQDRFILLRKLLGNYNDMRYQIIGFKKSLENFYGNLDPDVKYAAINSLNLLESQLTEYMLNKYSYNNYEENLKVFMLFSARMNEIIQSCDPDGKHSNK